MKLIVLGVIFYLYYHFFYRKSALNSANEDSKIESANQSDDEYTDYEEVE